MIRQHIDVDNENAVFVRDLHDQVLDAAIEDATGTLELLDDQGQPLAGFPVPMTHLGGGTYYGLIDDGTPLQAGSEYESVVQLTSPTSGSYKWRIPQLAKHRRR